MRRSRSHHHALVPIVATLALLLPGLSATAAAARPAADGATAAAEPSEAFAPAPCPPTVTEGAVDPAGLTCGFVTVPLRHATPQGPAIQIAVAVVHGPATTRATTPPVMLLAGGPGQSLLSTPGLTSELSPLPALAATRDVVLFDQRGVGLSRPALDCPEVFETSPGGALPSDAERVGLAVAAFAACRERLVAEGNDLSAYTTVENAADVDAVRTALGYGVVDLVGASYGTTLGLLAVRDDPAWVRSLTLDSPVPPEAAWLEQVGPTYQDALDRVAATCAARTACAAAYPDLGGTLQRVAARLADQPLPIPVPDPATGAVTEVPLTPAIFSQLVFTLFYSSPALDKVPAFVAAVDRDEPALVLALLTATGPPTGLTFGMQLSVLCAEEFAATDRERVQSAAEDLSPLVREQFLPFQPTVGLPGFDVCADWDVPRAPDAAFQPVASRVPTLVSTGAYDQVTSPAYGDTVARRLPESTRVEFAAGGHSPLLQSACGLQVLADFLADPAASPDTGCASAPLRLDLPPGRLAGPDRYATAAAVALAEFRPGVERAYVVSGTRFPDAVAAAPVAGREGAPVLLAAPDGLPTATVEALAALRPASVVVVGGPAAVPDQVLARLGELVDGPVSRLAGQDRHESAVAVAQAGAAADVRRVYLATSEGFADALAAAPPAAAPDAMLLLTASATLPAATAAALREADPEEVVILGGQAAVGAAVEGEVRRLLPGADVARVGGATRYATAAALALVTAEEGVTGGDPGRTRRVFLATGVDFPDALAGGAAAAADGSPLLLVGPGGTLDTALALPVLDPERLVALGGPRAVPEEDLLLAFLSS